MAIGEDKVRVVAYVDKDVLACVDRIADEVGTSRSSIVNACIEGGLDDLKFLGLVGFTPRRLQAIHNALVKVGVIRSGDVKVDVSAKVKKLGLGG